MPIQSRDVHWPKKQGGFTAIWPPWQERASQGNLLGQVSSEQVRSSSCTAADTWMRLGYKRLSCFCWGAKTILGTRTKKPAPRLKQAAENGSAQWQSQVLSANTWKVSDICWHALVPEAMLLPAPRLTSPTYQLSEMNGSLNTSRKSCQASNCSIRRNLSSSIMLF